MLPDPPGAERKKIGRTAIYLVSVIALLGVLLGFISFVAVKCSTHTMPLIDPTGNADATYALLQQQEVRMEMEALSKEKQVLELKKTRLTKETDRNMLAERILNKKKAINE
ncbi:unnamed protein product, partial [Chrysoparadoxa australica]